MYVCVCSKRISNIKWHLLFKAIVKYYTISNYPNDRAKSYICDKNICKCTAFLEASNIISVLKVGNNSVLKQDSF